MKIQKSKKFLIDFSYLEDFFVTFFNKSKSKNDESTTMLIINSSNKTDDPFDSTTYETIINSSNSTDSPFITLTSTANPENNTLKHATCQPKTPCDLGHSLSICCNNQKIKTMPINLAATIRVL